MKTIKHTNPSGEVVEVTLGDVVTLGDRVTLGDWVTLGDVVTLGDGVTLGDVVTLGDWVTLGDVVTLGDGVTLGDVVTLGDGVTLGANTLICAGRDKRGYEFLGVPHKGVLMIAAGCRWFTTIAAVGHWADNAEALAKVRFIEAEHARIAALKDTE